MFIADFTYYNFGTFPKNLDNIKRKKESISSLNNRSSNAFKIEKTISVKQFYFSQNQYNTTNHLDCNFFLKLYFSLCYNHSQLSCEHFIKLYANYIPLFLYQKHLCWIAFKLREYNLKFCAFFSPLRDNYFSLFSNQICLCGSLQHLFSLSQRHRERSHSPYKTHRSSVKGKLCPVSAKISSFKTKLLKNNTEIIAVNLQIYKKHIHKVLVNAYNLLFNLNYPLFLFVPVLNFKYLISK